MDVKTVHFSVDDVGSIFREICKKKYKNEEDLPIFGRLIDMHKKYGIKCHLYIYEPTSFFMAVKECICLKNFFVNSREWVSVSLHGNKVPFKKDYEYVSEWYLIDYICYKYDISRSEDVRLHNWYPTEEQKEFLKSKDVKVLFYPDDDCFRYNENDEFYHNGLLHRRTNVRIETLSNVDWNSLYINSKNSIVVFTHENCFLDMSDRIEQVIASYYEAGYIFI